ncbi:probable NADPH dehydrogenase [[Candida] jaroonii]|uniref:Probable NADPH dehydrogenase n=1 Tax=[Candida] jaroonii TaxID=467808 RepID=A0ACA9YF98_9ASCO|nr:probable NADPH dehydrogenase [[Candida] jaroonii]
MSDLVQITSLADTKVFEPLKVGDIELQHRVAFPPTTRYRANDDHTPSTLNLQYYKDRASTPGTLLVTEGVHVSPRLGLYRNAPGIWSQDQVKAWKKVTDAVHENGSFISIQFWALGRVADPQYMKELGLDLLAPSAVFDTKENEEAANKAGTKLRSITEEEIQSIILEDYTTAAKNAVAAGFDIIELHDAHGYLLDTFLQSSSNNRTDKYGGSIENRSRFILELIDHLTEIVGSSKLAIRISPYATFQGMHGVDSEIHPYVQFGYLLHELQKRADQKKELAYVSIVEPRVSGNLNVEGEITTSNQFVLDVWKGIIFRSGNYVYDAPEFKTLKRDVKDGRTIVGFSRFFITNPDLPLRLKNGWALQNYVRDLFYNVKENWGYNTWTKFGEENKYVEAEERAKGPKPIEIS